MALVEEVAEGIPDLPAADLSAFAELRVALELSPWEVGVRYVPENPTGLRIVDFGDPPQAAVVFGVIARDRLVTIVQLIIL